MKTLITNVTVLTMDLEKKIWKNGYVAIEQDKIIAVGPMEQLKDTQCFSEMIDGAQGILMPGMVNLHTHMGMIPFRGLEDDCPDRLRKFLFPMEQKAMDSQLVQLSTAYAAGEMLLSGVTCVFDMYYFEGAAAAAMDEMGLRGFAAQTIMDRDACDFVDPSQAMEYAKSMMEQYQDHPRIRVCAAPHGTSTCSSNLLSAVCHLNRQYQTPFSLHLAEMDYEMAWFQEHYHTTPVGFLWDQGLLDERTLGAHCIFFSQKDQQRFAHQGCSVAHCIGSNTKAGKGIAPVKEMQDYGITVGLGTDGPASGNTLDLFTQMKLTANFHKTANKDRSAFPAAQIVDMATMQGAKALHLDGIIGSIEPGKQADLVLVETKSVNMFPAYDPYSALVYSANASNVEWVFVAGTCLVRNKQLTRHSLLDLKKRLSDKMQQTAFATYFKPPKCHVSGD